jgi:hypothetical protein
MGRSGIAWTALAGGDESGAIISLSFDFDPGSLDIEDIDIFSVTGYGVKKSLSGRGKVRVLELRVVLPGKIQVCIDREGIESSVKTIELGEPDAPLSSIGAFITGLAHLEEGSSPDEPLTAALAGLDIADLGLVDAVVREAGKYVILDMRNWTFPGNTVPGFYDSDSQRAGYRPRYFPSNAMNLIQTNQYIKGVILPESIESIGDNAFRGCRYLVSLNIPEGVTGIGDHAFYDCRGLDSIAIPEGVTGIGDYAFQNCYGLVSIAIPESVTSIGKGAFQNCSGLVGSFDIPEGITTIADSAFYGCSGLTSIDIPDDVTDIGASAFRGCAGLTSIVIPDGVTSIEAFTFYGCTGLTSIDIPVDVTGIGTYAFAGSGLVSLTITGSVTSIGNYAFQNCAGLAEVSFELGTDPLIINASANIFSGCTGIGTLVFADTRVGLSGNPFPGDLASAYLSDGAGTYIRTDETTWTKQP